MLSRRRTWRPEPAHRLGSPHGRHRAARDRPGPGDPTASAVPTGVNAPRDRSRTRRLVPLLPRRLLDRGGGQIAAVGGHHPSCSRGRGARRDCGPGRGPDRGRPAGDAGRVLNRQHPADGASGVRLDARVGAGERSEAEVATVQPAPVAHIRTGLYPSTGDGPLVRPCARDARPEETAPWRRSRESGSRTTGC